MNIFNFTGKRLKCQRISYIWDKVFKSGTSDHWSAQADHITSNFYKTLPQISHGPFFSTLSHSITCRNATIQFPAGIQMLKVNNKDTRITPLAQLIGISLMF